MDGIQDVTRAIRRFPGPVVAAVHGYALGPAKNRLAELAGQVSDVTTGTWSGGA
jgi:1,4-dihydroxy-2-naphthoyl-CoA synthase